MENLAKRYLELKQEEERIKAEKQALGDEIKRLISEGNSLNHEGIEIYIQESISFEYLDEMAMVAYFKKNKFKNFIEEGVNSKALNKELKKSDAVLAIALKDFYKRKVTEKLCTRGVTNA